MPKIALVGDASGPASGRITARSVMKPGEVDAHRSGCGACDTAAAASATSYAAGHRARAVLGDGTRVCLRAIQPDDKQRLRTAFGRLSHQSVYQRFFNPITELTPGELRHLTELDFHDHVGLVLTVGEGTDEKLVAVARFVRVAPGADRAELGFAVADEYQNRGAATLLLHQLVVLARGCGIRELVAQMLEDNVAMLRVFQDSNRPLRQWIERGIRNVVLSIDAEM